MFSPRLSITAVLGAAAVLLLIASLLRACTEPYRPDSTSEISRRRLLRDDYEMSVYVKRGAWAPAGARPYLDVFSEYPQIATWFFGVPFLGSPLPVMDPKAMLDQLENARPWSGPVQRYGNVMSALMAAAWLGTIALVAKLARELGQSPARAWVLLGPACVYFALQRYDPLPAFVTTAAVLAFVRDRSLLGAGLLGAATMVKWYPAILLPMALGYVARRQGLRTAAWSAVVFGSVVVACIAPTFLAGYADPGWRAPHRPAGFADTPMQSGLAAVWIPYAFQGARAPNAGSLAERWIRVGLGADDSGLAAWLAAAKGVLLLAGASAAWLGWRAAEPRRLVAGAAALVVLFVLLNPIFSPQFVCWIVPLIAVAASGRWGWFAIGLALAIDVLTYLQFPWFIFMAPESPAGRTLPAGFDAVIQLRLAATVVLFLGLVVLTIRRPVPA